jgi:hypothetical protein
VSGFFFNDEHFTSSQCATPVGPSASGGVVQYVHGRPSQPARWQAARTSLAALTAASLARPIRSSYIVASSAHPVQRRNKSSSWDYWMLWLARFCLMTSLKQCQRPQTRRSEPHWRGTPTWTALMIQNSSSG